MNSENQLSVLKNEIEMRKKIEAEKKELEDDLRVSILNVIFNSFWSVDTAKSSILRFINNQH